MGRRILVINGPNLNLLGGREPEIYGQKSMREIQEEMEKLARDLDMEVDFFQSNHEGALVDRIQEAGRQKVEIIIINAGAYTHYSIAIHDALKAVAVPVIEVHMSNIFTRESFRHNSLISPLARGGIFGFGSLSYQLAIRAAYNLLEDREHERTAPQN